MATFSQQSHSLVYFYNTEYSTEWDTEHHIILYSYYIIFWEYNRKCETESNTVIRNLIYCIWKNRSVNFSQLLSGLQMLSLLVMDTMMGAGDICIPHAREDTCYTARQTAVAFREASTSRLLSVFASLLHRAILFSQPNHINVALTVAIKKSRKKTLPLWQQKGCH